MGFSVEEGEKTPSFKGLAGCALASSSYNAEGSSTRPSQNTDLGLLGQSLGFRIEDAMDLSRHPIFSQIKPNSLVADVRVGSSSKKHLEPLVQYEPRPPVISIPGGHSENWGETNVPDASPRTDASTDGTEERNQRHGRGQSTAVQASDSSDRSKEKASDQKTLRRLAQNREAARKSRLRKKAYVQQLESSKLKLTQLEQELQRARQQGIFISSSGEQTHSNGGKGALAFDAEYSRWLEEENKHISELRSVVNAHVGDVELRTIVESSMSHFEDIFRLKGNAAKADVFHILSGMWKTPSERCFMWIGGFRSSEILKVGCNPSHSFLICIRSD
ncbi:hypothetical protein SAY86_017505 [Trapa natans]|uniref:Uncharacterized protein n=1 Tax=Trapa natans TaxID=22666 RepID=A0AAN7R7G3_TRANT|nr:hypothetical protein SAY86_017505 [Trapa natans]